MSINRAFVVGPNNQGAFASKSAPGEQVSCQFTQQQRRLHQYLKGLGHEDFAVLGQFCVKFKSLLSAFTHAQNAPVKVKAMLHEAIFLATCLATMTTEKHCKLQRGCHTFAIFFRNLQRPRWKLFTTLSLPA